MSHTPGPWEVHNLTDVFSPSGGDSGNGVKADDNDGWLVADCRCGITFVQGQETTLDITVQQDNARLIAAAPKLLEACRWVANVANGIGRAGRKPEAGEFNAALAECQAAIAEAEGD